MAVIAVWALAQPARAQPSPAFEAASIHRNPGISLNTGMQVSGGELTATNASLKTLIRNAYDILSFQLAGGPRWLDTEMFDIVATTGHPAKISADELQSLLQNLLADRFGLRVHWEARESSVYALVIAKDGPKFKASPTARAPGINTRKGAGQAQMKAVAEPLSILAGNLGNQLGRFVLDKTGLSGVYDWTLEWDPDPTAGSALPSLLTAVQEQLGLRLEAQKGPMQTLVIDNAERPSEN